VVWTWVGRHRLLIFVMLTVAVTLGICAALEHADYLALVRDIPPDLDPEMRSRMEYHAFESTQMNFFFYLFDALPYLTGVLLVGAVIFHFTRPKS
jgi:hypothetical protein